MREREKRQKDGCCCCPDLSFAVITMLTVSTMIISGILHTLLVVVITCLTGVCFHMVLQQLLGPIPEVNSRLLTRTGSLLLLGSYFAYVGSHYDPLAY